MGYPQCILTSSERSITVGVGPLTHRLIAIAPIHSCAALDVGSIVGTATGDAATAVLGTSGCFYAYALGLVDACCAARAVTIEDSHSRDWEEC